MATNTNKSQEEPMSVRMARALAAFKRMPIADRFQLLVKAGLMTEAEAREAVERQGQAGKLPRKPKAPRKARVKRMPPRDGGSHRMGG
jgi:hypothetical protein